MKVLIVEDEKPAADKLIRLLNKIDEDLTVTGVLETVEDSINCLQHNPSPDLIFMDIQLDDGICFEIFETIKVETPVIFTTAYDKYAVRAFKVNSVDYLLKPIDENDLRNALNKFRSLHFNNTGSFKKIDSLVKEFSKQYKNRFLVKVGEHYKSIAVNDICYFYIAERNTFLKTAAGKTFVIDYSLEHVENMIDPAKFFRINRKHIVNIDAINDVISFSSSRLVLRLTNNQKSDDFVVSREKVSEFKKWMDR